MDGSLGHFKATLQRKKKELKKKEIDPKIILQKLEKR